MPTYEYECKSCSHSFEVFQSMNDPPLKDCPECGKEVRRLIFGGAGVIFKGSGFYVTDKGKGGKTSASKKSDGGTTGDSGSKTESTGGGASKGDTAKAPSEKPKTEPKTA